VGSGGSTQIASSSLGYATRSATVGCINEIVTGRFRYAVGTQRNLRRLGFSLHG